MQPQYPSVCQFPNKKLLANFNQIKQHSPCLLGSQNLMSWVRTTAPSAWGTGICAFLQYTLRAVRTVWAATYESCLLLWEVLGTCLEEVSQLPLLARAGHLLSP